MKKRYWIPICALVLLVGIVIIYVVVAEKALDQVVKKYDKIYAVDKGKDSTDYSKVPGYLELLRERSRLNSQLQMVKSDSVGLSLRLRDSVAELLVKGLAVTSFSLKEIGVSPLFNRMSPESLYELLSEPWIITGAVSTITRVPINVIQAPKDSSEVAPFVEPDTTHSEPVFFTLKTNKGVDLYFYQVERTSAEDRASWRKETKQEAMKQFQLFTDSIVYMAVPKYFPTIRIGMNRVDAKVLYRAIPSKAQVTVAF